MEQNKAAFESPEVVETFDAVEILGDTPAMSTGIVTGSGARG